MSIRRFSFFCILTFCTTWLNAQTIEYNKSKYSITSDSTVSLLSFGMNEKNPNKETLIPDSIVVHKRRCYKVTRIEQTAFKSNAAKTHLYLSNVKELILPSSLTEISSNTFDGKFNNLKSISINAVLKHIGNNAFVNLPSLTEVSINGGTQIDEWSFSSNPSLSHVALDTCIQIIGKNSFYNCTRLKIINLSAVKGIEEHAFESTALVFLNIPNCGIIGELAFADCRMLSKITFCDSLQMISDFAFYNNSSLKSLYIPSGTIGESAFMGCTSLNYVTISDSVESIGQAAFLGCSALNRIAIPSSITKIEAMTFADCINLRDIVLPNNLIQIGESAFEGCGIREVVIPASVTEIKENAFANCNELETVIIQSDIIKIGNNAFPRSTNIVRKNQLNN